MSSKSIIKKLTLENEWLRAEIKKRDELIAELKKRIEDLERRLGLTSRNSGKPPSSDGFKKQVRVQNLREKSGKKSGGQNGHKGATLKQVENPDSVEKHKLVCCPGCKHDLTNTPVKKFLKRQVFEIPKIKTHVTEHQLEVKKCPKCKQKVTASCDGFANAPVQYGPKTKAVVAYLNGQNLVPSKRTSQIMEDVFSIPISDATVENISKDCASRVEPVVEKIKESLKKYSVKCADESGVRVEGKTHWLHTLCDHFFVHYRISKKRGDVPCDIFGIVVHDHFASYFTEMKNVTHAFCNAHHLRELKAVTELDGENWARNMSRLLRIGCYVAQNECSRIDERWLSKFKNLYHKIIDKAIDYHEQIGPLKKSSGKRVKKRPAHNLLLRLKEREEGVLRFLSNPNVPFTNNLAEQSLRMIKVQQKISGSFRTLDGAKRFCMTRSYTATSQKHGIKVIDALYSAFNGQPINFCGA